MFICIFIGNKSKKNFPRSTRRFLRFMPPFEFLVLPLLSTLITGFVTYFLKEKMLPEMLDGSEKNRRQKLSWNNFGRHAMSVGNVNNI